MSNTKEKLIEILADCNCNAEYCEDCEFANDIDGCVRRQKEIVADHLVANGVTIPVRCKDCKHYRSTNDGGLRYCGHTMMGRCTKAYDFCSYGEREDNGKE